jgi:hypothetical protein
VISYEDYTSLMKSRSKNLLALLLIFIASAFLIGKAALELVDRTPTPAELLQPLTASQRQCVEKIIDGNTLISLTQQSPGNNFVLGYTGNKDLHVAVFSEDSQHMCHTEFKEKVFDCYEAYLDEYCGNFTLRLQKVETVELTGSAPAEMYVWFDILGVDRRSGARHQFYVRQPNDSLEMVLELKLCAGLSSVKIDNGLSKFIATDDIVCDTTPGRKEYIEYALPNGTPQKLRDDFDPL